MASYQNYATVVYENLREMYHAGALTYGEKTLFREKQNGEFVSYSYRRYCEDVDALGTALLAQKNLVGKRILLMGENSYAWALSFMAVICGVGVVVPVDKDISPEGLKILADTCEAAAVIHAPGLAAVAAAAGEGITCIGFDQLPTLIEDGKARIAAGDLAFMQNRIDSHAMSALIFTTGSSGQAKGVMLSHRNVCFNLSEMNQMIYVDEKDVFLSLLPIHHTFEFCCGILAPMYRGATVAFADDLRHITPTMREIRPTVIVGVPMLLDIIYKKIWQNIRKQGMERKIKASIHLTNAIPSPRTRLLAKRRAFSDIHKSFGGKLRALITGGASVDPDILKGLRDLGIQAYQGYRLTECAPLAALNRDTFFNDRSAGMASPNTLLDVYDVQNDGTGEIRFKGDNVMLGYFNQPEKTARAIRDGWFYTGDLGHIDKDGFLYITGRKKNVIVNADGKSIYPEELEDLLNRRAAVAESVVVGYANESRDYDVVAIIRPDYDYLSDLCGGSCTPARLDTELKKVLSEVNASVPSYKRIRTYVLRQEEFPKNTTRKIKRAGIADLHRPDYLANLKK